MDELSAPIKMLPLHFKDTQPCLKLDNGVNVCHQVKCSAQTALKEMSSSDEIKVQYKLLS